jgi:hypothetical protein
MSVEVLVNTDDITVLGPPAEVKVQLDIGATGVRGSKVFVGTGDPALSTTTNPTQIFEQDLYIGDLYINNAPGEEYSYMYQYIAALGNQTWIPVLKINPTIYSANHLQTFTSGSTTIIIPIVNIVQITGTPLTEDNFSIKFSIGHSNPVATSISSVAITGTSNDQLSITLKAAELDSGVWEDLSSTVTVHMLITVILDPISQES